MIDGNSTDCMSIFHTITCHCEMWFGKLYEKSQKKKIKFKLFIKYLDTNHFERMKTIL